MNNQRNVNILLLLIIICISVFGGLIVWELHEANMQRKSEFSRTINIDFFSNPIDTTIMHAIDDGKPILKQNGGKSDEYDLDDYLAHFEAVKNYLDASSLNLRDVYDNYAHYVEVAYNCPEVQKYIHDLRTSHNDSAYYINFEKLAIQMFQIEGKIKK